MIHGLVFYLTSEGVEIGKQLYADSIARAFGESFLSEVKGFVALSDTTSNALSAKSGYACPANPQDCIDLIMDPVRGVVSDHKSQPYMVFALGQVEPGFQDDYEEHVLSARPPRGVRDAVARAYGSSRCNVVIEVVGKELEDVHRHLRRLTDLPYLSGLSVMHFAPNAVKGFGSGAARQA